MTWEQRLREWLSYLCKKYYGMPCPWPESEGTNSQITDLYSKYLDAGCLPISDAESQEKLCELRTHLADPGNNLSQADNDKLDEIIETCLKDDS